MRVVFNSTHSDAAHLNDSSVWLCEVVSFNVESMQQQNIVALAVVILTISSFGDNPCAQQMSGNSAGKLFQYKVRHRRRRHRHHKPDVDLASQQNIALSRSVVTIKR